MTTQMTPAKETSLVTVSLCKIDEDLNKQSVILLTALFSGVEDYMVFFAACHQR